MIARALLLGCAALLAAADDPLFCGFERGLDGFSDDGAELCRAAPAEGEACLRLSNGDGGHVRAGRRLDLRLGLRARSTATDSIAICACCARRPDQRLGGGAAFAFGSWHHAASGTGLRRMPGPS